MKKIFAILMALILAMSFAAMAEAADYNSYNGNTYTGRDPWGGTLTLTIDDVADGRMDWTFTDSLDGMTFSQSIEGTALADGAGEFHLACASLEAEYETIDYTGTINLSDGVIYFTYTDGELTEHSENGGSTAYHVAALDEMDRALVLKPMPMETAEAIERFCDVWVDEDTAVEIWYEDGFRCRATLGEDLCIDYETCVFNEAEGTLECTAGTRYTERYDEAAGDVVAETIVTDLTASFELIEDGEAMIWNDSEGICKRFMLKRLSDAEAEEWQEAQAFVGRWGQGRCTIDITGGEAGAYHVYISWSGSAFEQAVWEYDCVYDGLDKALNSYAPGVKRIETWAENGELADTRVEYEDGSAAFTLDDQDRLTWNDYKENAAEDMLFERGVLME